MDESEKIEQQVKIENGISIDPEKLKEVFASNQKQGIHTISKYLISKFWFKAVADSRSEDLYIYNKGIYTRTGPITIKSETERILGELSSTHSLNEIIEKVKRITIIPREDFKNESNNLICVNNGILDIETMELKPHDPNLIFTSKIPVDFTPDAKCPKIKKFLKDILYKEDISVVEEWIGFCLLRVYLFKKAIIFFGPGDTGKSTLLNLLVKFIGRDNVSDIGLYKLSSNTFASAKLYQKLVNVYDDLDFKDIIDIGRFKTACGKAPLDAEKKFGEPFWFFNFAKLTFTTNKIPQVKNKDADDSAYFSRWLVIRCDNVFDKNEIDPYYLEKITSPEELSGLLNCALKWLERLLKNKRFSYNKNWEEVKTIMERSGSPLASFVQDELSEKQGGWISKQGLYEAYLKYTKDNSLPAMTKEKLGRQITRYAPYIIDSKQGNKTGWRNVAFINPPIEKVDVESLFK